MLPGRRHSFEPDYDLVGGARAQALGPRYPQSAPHGLKRCPQWLQWGSEDVHKGPNEFQKRSTATAWSVYEPQRVPIETFRGSWEGSSGPRVTPAKSTEKSEKNKVVTERSRGFGRMGKRMRPKPAPTFWPFWTRVGRKCGPQKVPLGPHLIATWSTSRRPGAPGGVPPPLEQHPWRRGKDALPVGVCVRSIEARVQK